MGPQSTSNLALNHHKSDSIKDLQDELSRTKELLIDQQTNYLQLQAQQRQDSNAVSIIYKDFQSLLNQALTQQKDSLFKDFKAIQFEQERKLMQQIKDTNAKFETSLNEKFECKLAEFQENLIKHYESEFEDLEHKIKRVVDTVVKEEQLSEKMRSKQVFERIEKDLKNDTEKYIQNYFRNQSELFKDQIKSGVLQEHLIHKDLINSKLEKLFRTSEEKRRKTNFLFARHMSGLNFFVDNAHKQLSVLKEAQQDLLKNRDLVDYYGDEAATVNNADSKPLSSLSSLSLSTIGIGQPKLSINSSSSKDNLFEIDDENLLDENLIEDLA